MASKGGECRDDVIADERCFQNPFKKDPLITVQISKEFILTLREVILKNLSILEKINHNDDQSVYTGISGVALLHIHVAQHVYHDVTASQTHYLQIALHMLEPCLRNLNIKRPTYLCGGGGPLALGAYLYHALGDEKQSQECVSRLKDLCPPTSSPLPYELLYGHAGYLYSLLFVTNTVPQSSTLNVLIEREVAVILDAGQRESKLHGSSSPLMFTWHGKHYLGAAHGLTGILTLLLQVPLESLKPAIAILVKPSIEFLLSVCLPSGNLPSSLESSHSDRLVHWCHGAPGLVHLLAMAYKVFGVERYLEEAVRCGEVVWQRGLLKKGCGLCHGVAGNAYTFLQLFKLTKKDLYLYRAAKFGEWCLSSDEHHSPKPDHPYSLFEGLAGTTYFYCDLLAPETATFPALELTQYKYM